VSREDISAGTYFHCANAGLVFTCLFVVTTAGSLGPFAPILIAGALYVLLWAVTTELALWLWWIAGRHIGRWLQRRPTCERRPT
jgi:hypothetical protein